MKKPRIEPCPMCKAPCKSDGCDETVWHCQACGDVVLDMDGEPLCLRDSVKRLIDHCPRCGRTCTSAGEDDCNKVWHCPDCGHVCLRNGEPVVLEARYQPNKPTWMRAFDVVALVAILLLIGWLAIIMGELLSGLEGYILGAVAGTLTMAATGWRYRP